jgi:ribonuclease BN (tRNA processing enzyme)
MFKVYDADRGCGCRGGSSMNGVCGPVCRSATKRMPRCGSRSSAWRSLATAAFLALTISSKGFAACSAPVAVQVLGSGGPDSNDARASSGYLLWLDGEARLSGYLDGSGGMVRADIVEMDAAAETPIAAFGNDRFKLTAIGVKHGPVPALGYLVEVRGRRIAFAGDQNGDNPAFATMIKGVDILVMDHAVPEMADPVARQLHARPSEIGLLAAHAGVKQLVLSHNMARSLGPLKENLALIRQHYDGPTKVAEDLMCVD